MGEQKSAYFVTVLISTKPCQATKIEQQFLPSGIRWGSRITNLNGTIEIKSLVFRRPKNFHFAMTSHRAALSCNPLFISTFSSFLTLGQFNRLKESRVKMVENKHIIVKVNGLKCVEHVTKPC